jgi:hypothetical protein
MRWTYCVRIGVMRLRLLIVRLEPSVVYCDYVVRQLCCIALNGLYLVMRLRLLDRNACRGPVVCALNYCVKSKQTLLCALNSLLYA